MWLYVRRLLSPGNMISMTLFRQVGFGRCQVASRDGSPRPWRFDVLELLARYYGTRIVHSKSSSFS
jgi:hypothetical protein